MRRLQHGKATAGIRFARVLERLGIRARAAGFCI